MFSKTWYRGKPSNICNFKSAHSPPWAWRTSPPWQCDPWAPSSATSSPSPAWRGYHRSLGLDWAMDYCNLMKFTILSGFITARGTGGPRWRGHRGRTCRRCSRPGPGGRRAGHTSPVAARSRSPTMWCHVIQQIFIFYLHLVLRLDVQLLHLLDGEPDGVLVVAGHHDADLLNKVNRVWMNS